MKQNFFPRLACLAVMFVWMLGVYADVIVLTDGTTKNVYNIEVAEKYLYYTTEPGSENVQRIALDKVFAYKIGDGKMIALDKTSSQKPGQAAPVSDQGEPTAAVQVAPVPSADNARIVSLYNTQPPLVYKDKTPNPEKHTGYFISLWGMEESSVLSDSVLDVGFEHVYLEGDKARSIVGQRLKVTNKTFAPVYIDLANSFRLMNGGYSEPYFTNSVYNEGGSSSSGGSVNLGAVAGALGVGGAVGTLANGINVGKSNTASAGISSMEQQILIVPARSSVTMPGRKVTNGKTILECYEPIFFCQRRANGSMEKYALKQEDVRSLTIIEDQMAQKVADDQSATRESLGIKHWMQTDYTPENTPKKLGWIITYSTRPDFSRYTSLPVNMYMRGSFGLNMLSKVYLYYNSKTYDPSPNPDYMITGGGQIGKE